MPRYPVLITGIGGNVGQGVLKSLRAARKTYHIVGIDMEPLSAGFSLVDRYYQTPRTSDTGFAKALAEILKAEEVQAIYVCSPSELEFFASNKEELQNQFGLSVFVNPPEVINIGSDKLKTAEFLRDAGFPAPKSVLSTDSNGVKGLIEEYGLPLIVKPRGGYSSRDVFVVNSLEEIQAAATLVPDLIVQRYLPDAQAEYTAATLSDADRKVRALITLRRDLLQGTTYRTELLEDENIDRQVIKIVEALGAVGPCNLQFRLVDGTPYVFEINPRFSGTSGIRYLYGFNDCDMIFDLLHLGQEVTQPRLQHAVVLRYWNEVCISNASFQDLREGRLSHSGVQTVLQKPTV